MTSRTHAESTHETLTRIYSERTRSPTAPPILRNESRDSYTNYHEKISLRSLRPRGEHETPSTWSTQQETDSIQPETATKEQRKSAMHC